MKKSKKGLTYIQMEFQNRAETVFEQYGWIICMRDLNLRGSINPSRINSEINIRHKKTTPNQKQIKAAKGGMIFKEK